MSYPVVSLYPLESFQTAKQTHNLVFFYIPCTCRCPSLLDRDGRGSSRAYRSLPRPPEATLAREFAVARPAVAGGGQVAVRVRVEAGHQRRHGPGGEGAGGDSLSERKTNCMQGTSLPYPIRDKKNETEDMLLLYVGSSSMTMIFLVPVVSQS